MKAQMNLFSNCPRIKKRPPGIVVTTSLLWQIVLLRLSFRKVTVDLGQEIVDMNSRYLWLLNFRRGFQFQEIKAITYGYSTTQPQPLFTDHKQGTESFSVGLRLLDDREIHLFNFVGEGTFSNVGSLLPDWLYWEEFPFSLSGSQASQSRAFVELLSNILNVPVIRPRC